ncbi:DUF1173 domain-containing protein [Ferrovibrio sp.]|uniref:DUF1173 domain-containing protein n=1 Tax=Ferrovibrio sp. TaxID=1917215 RepID=UPI00312022A1
MSQFDLGGKAMRPDQPEFSDALAGLYSSRFRPKCMCRNPGVEMYIAKVQGKFIVKRMPDSGQRHSPNCDSFEPPPELSGLGEVAGSAIRENPDDGTTTIKLGFSLTKTGARTAPPAGEGEGGSVKSDGSKLTIRGVLHLLWEEAGFNKWSPAMAGKRNWYVIRKYLLQAAADKVAKGAGLSDMLYIPENYHPDKAAEISQRRTSHLSRVASTGKGIRRLMMVVGEVKELSPSRYGHKIILKHLPDYPFMLNEDIHRRLLKRFELDLGLWDAVEGAKLIVIGAFGVGPTGVASLEEVALMACSENWLPFENLYEKSLLDTLHAGNRRFSKCLRYNLAADKPLASVVLTDTAPDPFALYVVPPGSSAEYQASVDQLIADSRFPAWIWNAGEGSMPALPSIAR